MTEKKNLGLFRDHEGSEVQLCTKHWREATGGDKEALTFDEYLDDEKDECDVCGGTLGIEKIKEACLPRQPDNQAP